MHQASHATLSRMALTTLLPVGHPLCYKSPPFKVISGLKGGGLSTMHVSKWRHPLGSGVKILVSII